MQQQRVLCVSRDPALLKTREMVLASRGYQPVSVPGLAQMRMLPSTDDFSLILLCHTLSSGEFDRAAELARQRWPAAKIVALISSGPDRASWSGEMAHCSEGPRVLLQTMEHLVAA